MSIRVKTIFSLVGTMIVSTVVLYFTLYRIVSDGFAAVENTGADKDIERVRETFASNIEAICVQTVDWSIWDDAYQFLQDKNAEFVQANISPSTMSTLSLAALLFFDKNGEVFWSTSYDPKGGRFVPVPPRILLEHFSKKSALVRHTKEDGEWSGLLLTPGSTPLIFCSKPILPTSGKGEIRGALVFASPFDKAAHKALMRTTKLKLAFAEEDGKGFAEPITPILQKLRSAGARFVDDSDPKTLVSYTRFADFNGKKSLIARIEIPRQVLEQAKMSCRYLAVALVVFGLAFIAVTILLMESAVLRRLAKLNADVTRITESFDFSGRVAGAAKDELGKLGLCINRLLAAVAQIQHARSNGEKSAPEAEKGGENG